MPVNQRNWKNLSLTTRVRWLRYILPPLLAIWVVTYQLLFAQSLEAAYGHAVHYGVEIAFYSLAGPLVTWITLTWVERNLSEKERLEQQVRRIEREKAAVLEEERARLARDLHDGIAQTLYFLALKADMLRQQLTGRAQAQDELRDMSHKIRQIIREVRRTIYALQPINWAPEGFVTALCEFVEGFAEQAGWQLVVKLDPELTIAPELEPAVFRLVQETLNNIAKHAEADHVWVSLTSNVQMLELSIRDDGLGFETKNQKGHGFGLRQMQERVRAAEGTMKIESHPGQGTILTAKLPQGVERRE